jgi:hypothetical protein
MAGNTVGWAISAAIRLFLAMALLAGIVGTFHAQLGSRRKALAVSRATGLPREGEAFFVRYAGQRNFADRRKAFAGDAFGVLTVTPRAVVFRAGPPEAPWSMEFLPGHARAGWVGRRWINGAFSWFAITAGGETHYFTSAERPTVWGSRRRTGKIHEAVLARLG